MARVPAPASPTPLLPVTRAGRLSAKRLPPLTREEAKRLTREVKDKTAPAWLLIERAHHGKAHEVLGFNTWRDYVERELGLSESRTFQLLEQAKVMREIAAAGFDVADADPIPTRVVSKIKNNLPRVREVAVAAMAADEDIYLALRALAQEIAPDPAKGRTSPAEPRPGETLCPCCNGSGVMSEMAARLMTKTIEAQGL